MQLGVQRAGAGVDGVAWHVLGQTLRPMQRSEHCLAWHTTVPPGTFVPPHLHHKQDEFFYILAGQLEFEADGQSFRAGPGDLASLPRGMPHAFYNRSGAVAQTLIWVTPAGLAWEMFTAMSGVDDPQEVMRIASAHELEFLPPR